MAYELKKEVNKKERLAGGHRLCAGCGAGIAVRGVLRALKEEDKAVIGNATRSTDPRLVLPVPSAGLSASFGSIRTSEASVFSRNSMTRTASCWLFVIAYSCWFTSVALQPMMNARLT